jgi:hypothetical protein
MIKFFPFLKGISVPLSCLSFQVWNHKITQKKVQFDVFDRINRIMRIGFIQIVRQGGSGVSPLAAGTRYAPFSLRSEGILPIATNFSQLVSSLSSVLACCKRRTYLLGTPTSPSALTSRAIFLADEDVSAPREIRWRSRLGSVRTRLSALPGKHALLSVTLLPI